MESIGESDYNHFRASRRSPAAHVRFQDRSPSPVDHFKSSRQSPDTYGYYPIPGYDSRNAQQEYTYIGAPNAASGQQIHGYVAYPQAYAYPAPVYEPPKASPVYAYPPPQYAYAPQYVQYAAPTPPEAKYYTYAQPTAQYAAPYPYAAPAIVDNNNAGGTQHVWYGRSKAQVDEDNMKIAAREGLFKETSMAPHKPKDDQMFWVVELDGGHTLR